MFEAPIYAILSGHSSFKESFLQALVSGNRICPVRSSKPAVASIASKPAATSAARAAGQRRLCRPDGLIRAAPAGSSSPVCTASHRRLDPGHRCSAGASHSAAARIRTGQHLPLFSADSETCLRSGRFFTELHNLPRTLHAPYLTHGVLSNRWEFCQ